MTTDECKPPVETDVERIQRLEMELTQARWQWLERNVQPIYEEFIRTF